jgi:acyl-CoA thioesterase-1
MICRGAVIAGTAALLAACGDEAPPAPSERTEAREMAAEAEVSGEERRILAFGDSLFAGYGLATDEGYPEKLEAALRARGINARWSSWAATICCAACPRPKRGPTSRRSSRN